MVNPDGLGNMDMLKKHGFRFKKKWGQNFLFDKNFLRRIAKGADIKPGECVVEIGPGSGNLTKALLEEGAKVIAIEIDKDLIPILHEVLQSSGATVIQGDVLKLNLDEVVFAQGWGAPYKIVANLPYYITTPIIMSILENDYQFEQMVVMVQWEVAERLTAKPGTKEYGAITVAVNYYTESKILFKVSRHLFTPSPEVDSAVLCLKRRTKTLVDINANDKKMMFQIIRAAFCQRRKTLFNSLLAVSPAMEKETIRHIMSEAGIDGQRRGETLSIEEFARLATIWQKISLNKGINEDEQTQ